MGEEKIQGTEKRVKFSLKVITLTNQWMSKCFPGWKMFKFQLVNNVRKACLS